MSREQDDDVSPDLLAESTPVFEGTGKPSLIGPDTWTAKTERRLRPEVRSALDGVITFYHNQVEDGAIGWDLLDAERYLVYAHHWLALDREAEKILGSAFNRYAEEFASPHNDVVGLLQILNHFQTDRQLIHEIEESLRNEHDPSYSLATPMTSDPQVEEVRIWVVSAMKLARLDHSALAVRAILVAVDVFNGLPSDTDRSNINYLALQLATAWTLLGKLDEAVKICDTYAFPEWQRSPCYEEYAGYLARNGHFSEALHYASKNVGIDEENKEWFARRCNHALLISIAEQYAKSDKHIESFALLVLLWKEVKCGTLPLWILPKVIKPMAQIGFQKEAIEVLHDVLVLHKPPYEDGYAAGYVSTIFYEFAGTELVYEEVTVDTPQDSNPQKQ